MIDRLVAAQAHHRVCGNQGARAMPLLTKYRDRLIGREPKTALCLNGAAVMKTVVRQDL